jgi:hypothetical protein
MQQAGFSNAALVSETGFNSSPKTKGVLFRAAKGNFQSFAYMPAFTHRGNKMDRIESEPKEEDRKPEE